MRPFETLHSVAAYLPEVNIDTDAIFPARYLLLLDRDGLGQYAFYDRRFTRDGKPIAGFVLNQPPFDTARILIAGQGFGCGSSREQAVWALDGFGFACVIAPDFGDIFRTNCLKNGILPVQLPPVLVNQLGESASKGAVLSVDLSEKTISLGQKRLASIEIEEGHRQSLLNGWDETEQVLQDDGEHITAFEGTHRASQPWLFRDQEGT